MANTKGSGPEAAFRLGNVNATVWSNSTQADSGSREFRTGSSRAALQRWRRLEEFQPFHA